MTIKDIGPEPQSFDLEKPTLENTSYRAVAWSGKYLQLTLMSIPVGEEIGLEAHPETDQFLRLDAGRGRVQMGRTKDRLDFDREVEDGWPSSYPPALGTTSPTSVTRSCSSTPSMRRSTTRRARSMPRPPTRSATRTQATTSRQTGRSSLPSSRRTSTPDQRGLCSSPQGRARPRRRSAVTADAAERRTWQCVNRAWANGNLQGESVQAHQGIDRAGPHGGPMRGRARCRLRRCARSVSLRHAAIASS